MSQHQPIVAVSSGRPLDRQLWPAYRRATTDSLFLILPVDDHSQHLVRMASGGRPAPSEAETTARNIEPFSDER